MNGLTKAPSARDWINQAVKKSQAEYASGKVEKATSGQVGPASLTDAYKQSDVETFKAMTGWNLVVLNGATMILDDDGNPPPPDSPLTDRLVDLSGAIGSDRQDGKLTGDITPEYLNDIFDRFANVEREFSSDWLDKAFNYLEGDSDRKVASS
ncbi:hypothetical protein [Sphingomonas aerophila]|uniref:Uncharacterized protein n=1 Tax=Sphingomonas aerophila TaxID=1344948 RepID=A0A7W9EUY9_9SPHN|nr:hypothetical protein [Sphingomonas aerophila]MBB5714157.1 hypothetical protein [Sphingomonas aerophila]